MKITCYSYSANGNQLLGGIKENSQGFSLFLQDKREPFKDLIGSEKREVFTSFQQALSQLENLVCSVSGSREVVSEFPVKGEF